jgi:hypothetical protein
MLMGSTSRTPQHPNIRRPRNGQARLLKNDAHPHEFTREDRAKGGRACAGRCEDGKNSESVLRSRR